MSERSALSVNPSDVGPIPDVDHLARRFFERRWRAGDLAEELGLRLAITEQRLMNNRSLSLNDITHVAAEKQQQITELLPAMYDSPASAISSIEGLLTRTALMCERIVVPEFFADRRSTAEQRLDASQYVCGALSHLLKRQLEGLEEARAARHPNPDDVTGYIGAISETTALLAFNSAYDGDMIALPGTITDDRWHDTDMIIYRRHANRSCTAHPLQIKTNPSQAKSSKVPTVPVGLYNTNHRTSWALIALIDATDHALYESEAANITALRRRMLQEIEN